MSQIFRQEDPVGKGVPASDQFAKDYKADAEDEVLRKLRLPVV